MKNTVETVNKTPARRGSGLGFDQSDADSKEKLKKQTPDAKSSDSSKDLSGSPGLVEARRKLFEELLSKNKKNTVTPSTSSGSIFSTQSQKTQSVDSLLAEKQVSVSSPMHQESQQAEYAQPGKLEEVDLSNPPSTTSCGAVEKKPRRASLLNRVSSSLFGSFLCSGNLNDVVPYQNDVPKK